MPSTSTNTPAQPTPLWWLHGFTQTSASAHRFRSILTGHRPLTTPDLPGHGSQSNVEATLEETADLIAAAMPSRPVVLGGYSLGGRVALHVALRHPDKIAALVVLGATRGIHDEAVRQQRRDRDGTLAQHLLDVGVDTFLNEWLAQPMFASLPNDAEERDARRHNTASGLASSLLFAGTGTQSWLEDPLRTLNVPTLALAGAGDDRFAAEARALSRTVPTGTFALIPGAGHAAHLQQPALTARLIETFCSNYG